MISETARPSDRPRVIIVTGSYGSGHDCAARELAREVEIAGGLANVVDVVELIPAGLGPLLRSTYYAQLRLRPQSWEAMLERLQPGRPLHRATIRALATVVPALTRAAEGADLVISTHPFASQALGIGRQHGTIGIPAVTYLTDPSVHPLWIHPDVDLHLAILEEAANEARGWGALTRVVRPVVTPAARCPDDGADPLAGEPVRGGCALIAGGSLGIGEIERTVGDVLAVGGWTPVVLCGTNTALHRKLRVRDGVVALAWRDDVPALMRRAGCVINNGGGFTTVEALTVGVPLVSYRPLPGHGRANAVSLERAGLAAFARDRLELGAVLGAVLGAALGRGRLEPMATAPSVMEALGALTPAATPKQLAVT